MTYQPIAGPYAYGSETPPYHLMGWVTEDGAEFIDPIPAARQAFDDIAPDSPEILPYSEFRTRFRQTPTLDTRPPWEIVRACPHFVKEDLTRPHPFEGIPKTLSQFGPSCVGASATGAWNWRLALDIALLGQEEAFRYGFIPFPYGASRCHPNIGNRRLGRSGGSYVSWGAKALNQCGMLFEGEGYADSSHTVQEWGRSGPPKEAYEKAADNLTTYIAPLESLTDIRTELLAYKPVMVASARGFRMAPREWKGLHVFTPSGRWLHAMFWLWWSDDHDGAAYRMNSWGADAHGRPLNQEPPGGAWNLASDIESEIRDGLEAYAMERPQGDPGPVNPSPV